MEAISRTGCERDADGRLKKSGPRVRDEEFEALKYARRLGLPVPEVYDFQPDTRTIRMDFVEGETLESVWPTMTEDDKKSVARQLGRLITLMRSGRQDKVLIGNINGPARDCCRYKDYAGGPFTDETEFNKFLLNLYPQCPQAVRESLLSMMRSNHGIRFTHGDLTPRNIIIKNGEIQAIVDREFAGWYPEYYEYVKFFECQTNCKDWKNFTPYVFEKAYGEELVIQQAILRWQRL